MYDYQKQKQAIFTKEGHKMFLKIRDNAQALLQKAGAFQMEHAWKDVYGSSWDMLACVDRLVELGELKEISPSGCAAQHRVFIRKP